MKKTLLAIALALTCAGVAIAAPSVRKLEFGTLPSTAGPQLAVIFDAEGCWLAVKESGIKAKLATWEQIDYASEKLRGYQSPVMMNGVHIYRMAPMPSRTIKVKPAKPVTPTVPLLHSTTDEAS